MVVQHEEDDDPPAPPSGLDVLDACAVLAMLRGESGADVVAEAVVRGAVITTVTLAEIFTIMVRDGLDPSMLTAVVEEVFVVTFDVADAMAAGAMVQQTAALGLSLGDRACLATAMRLGGRVLTADAIWGQLDIGVEIVLIRHP